MRYYMHLSYVIRANVINSIFMFRVFENKEREFWGYMADTFLNTDPLLAFEIRFLKCFNSNEHELVHCKSHKTTYFQDNKLRTNWSIQCFKQKRLIPVTKNKWEHEHWAS